MVALGIAGDVGVVTGVVVLGAVAGGLLWLLAGRRRRERILHGPLRPAVDGALVTVGVLAVVDNVVFHWLLGFHRFKEGWPGSIYVEVALVVLGAAMVWVGLASLRRQGLVGRR